MRTFGCIGIGCGEIADSFHQITVHRSVQGVYVRNAKSPAYRRSKHRGRCHRSALGGPKRFSAGTSWLCPCLPSVLEAAMEPVYFHFTCTSGIHTFRIQSASRSVAIYHVVILGPSETAELLHTGRPSLRLCFAPSVNDAPSAPLASFLSSSSTLALRRKVCRAIGTAT